MRLLLFKDFGRFVACSIFPEWPGDLQGRRRRTAGHPRAADVRADAAAME